jgi:AcrR family transcriptional regulator
VPERDVASTPGRPRLSRERVLEAAVHLADEKGLDELSMRKLGQVLGVEAMSLYKHVAGKDDLLDGIADLIAGEIEVPTGPDWRLAMRRSAISAHEVLLRHPWASGLLESRVNLGPARLRYVDAVIGVLRSAGFSMPDVGRAFMALDSHTYGFTLQELSWPFDVTDAPQVAETMALAFPADEYPNLAAMIETVTDAPQSVPLDFEFGLDLILDGLERRRPTPRGRGQPGAGSPASTPSRQGRGSSRSSE